jgi:hypothetical protein
MFDETNILFYKINRKNSFIFIVINFLSVKKIYIDILITIFNYIQFLFLLKDGKKNEFFFISINI